MNTQICKKGPGIHNAKRQPYLISHVSYIKSNLRRSFSWISAFFSSFDGKKRLKIYIYFFKPLECQLWLGFWWRAAWRSPRCRLKPLLERKGRGWQFNKESSPPTCLWGAWVCWCHWGSVPGYLQTFGPYLSCIISACLRWWDHLLTSDRWGFESVN